MPLKNWTGAGANELWNTAANWSGGTIPVTGDDIVFDGAGANGKKNCTLNVNFNALSVTFTAGYSDTGISPNNGTFTFGGNLTVTTGGITLGANTTYATSGAVTTYTLTFNSTSTLTSNGKTLPVNLSLNLGSGATITLAGDASFQGNLSTASTAHNLKAATLTTVNLSIGGNVSLLAVTVNTTDHVTIKCTGTSKTYISGAAANNIRCNFVSGSSYTSAANSALSGTSFLTVEPGGQFNPVSTHSFSNNGTTTLSGFNSSNSSSFFAYTAGVLVLSNDTIISSFIQIQNLGITIASTGASKLLLEGNLISTGLATTTIDRLEFSGTTASNVTATSNPTNLRIKELIINKTGAGSVDFNSNGIFTLHTPTANTYSWTHTAGTITQNGTCIIRFSGLGIMNYNATSPTPFTFRTIEVYGSSLSLNTTLNATTFKITPIVNSGITSSASFGFNTDQLIVVNSSAAARTISLKSGVVYNINTELIMLNPTGFTISLVASASPTRAIFNLDTAATQFVEYVNPDYIDSSGTGGVLPYTKQQIYSQNGTITATTINWSNTAQPPPVAAKVTVGYTFVN